MPCAFCRKPGPLTREHIWPKWLHASHDYSLKYHSAPDKVLPAEHIIKDVCAECNNGPLSALDDYVKSLHHRYFSKSYQTIKKTTFKYDFEKLTKWLLKVSYNSARAARARRRASQALCAVHHYTTVLTSVRRNLGLVIGAADRNGS
jgi:hypothetical protein